MCVVVFLKSNLSNNTSDYPTENSNMDKPSSGPDCHTTDVVTYVKRNSNQKIDIDWFYSAVQYGFYERVVELIEADPQLASATLNDNITLLHWAAINNRIDIGKYLISKGAKVDAVGGVLSATPLQWAIRDGKFDSVLFLLSHEANPEFIDGEGKRWSK